MITKSELDPNFQNFNISVKCGLCSQNLTYMISDVNKQDAQANAIQTALLKHQCPSGQKPKTTDFKIV